MTGASAIGWDDSTSSLCSLPSKPVCPRPVASDLTPTTEAHAGEYPLVDPKDVKVFFFKAFMMPMVWY